MRALIFDLDGTLVDTVYTHVLAWQGAFTELGMAIEAWQIHRRIGMSREVFTRELATEVGRSLTPEETQSLARRHSELFAGLLPRPQPLPGAVKLLEFLRANRILHGIATSGSRPGLDASLEAIGARPETLVIQRSDVLRAKPAPDLFLACQERLGVAVEECYVVGDATWDHLAAGHAGMRGIGVLSGGNCEEELRHAGAFRVVRDMAELHRSLGELGLLT